MVFKSPAYHVIAVPVEKIKPNTYNPNAVAPPEMKLLYESIKADGYTLHHTDVIHGTLFFKICQCNMTALLVNFYGSDRRRHFLDQGQFLFPIAVIGSIDQFF